MSIKYKSEVKLRSTFDLEHFFELCPDLIWIADYDGCFQKVNPAVLKILGYSEGELLESPVNSFIHPDDQGVYAERLFKLIDGEPLLNYENRWITQKGTVVWLLWTSFPIKRDKLIFAIAKDITYKKNLEEYERISSILDMIHTDHRQRFGKNQTDAPFGTTASTGLYSSQRTTEHSMADQLWLSSFEMAVRKHAGKLHMNLHILSEELAVSERQLYRYIKRILNITPNKLVQVIRLQLAWEAIASGKYRTISEISYIAGYSSRAHFSKLFKEIYGIHVSDLL